MTLTAEQKAMIEQKRQAALRRREEKARERALLAANQPQANHQPQSNCQPQTSSINRTTNITSSTTNVQQQQNSAAQPRFNQTANNPQFRTNQMNSTATSTTTTNQSSRVTNFTSSTFKQPTVVNNQPSSRMNGNPMSNNTNANYMNNSFRTNPSTATTLNQNSNYYNRMNQQASHSNFNKTNSTSKTQPAPWQQSTSYFITPTKRPSEQTDQGSKRQNVEAKSPYEQVMDRSIPIMEISFKLINNREFYLDFRFSSKLIDAVKKFQSARYDAVNKRWVFKLEHYKEICDALKKLQIDRLKLKINPGFPDNVLTILQDTLKYDEMKVNLEEKISHSVIEKLFPYQREGIKFGIRREGRCLLADDCGLGKTMQAIGIALWYFDDWPLLVVCPASVKFQWKSALLKWVPGLIENDIKEIDSKKFDPNQSGSGLLVVIASYDSLHKVESYLKKPSCVILDESHMIKDSKTKRFNEISKLVNKSNRLILISGTPAMSRPVELFTQLKLLMPKIFTNKEKYINRYCDPKMTQWGKVANGCANLDELKVLLLSTVMVRRMKDDVLNELPPKRRAKVNLDCHLTSKDKSEIEKFVSRFKGPQQLDDENESFTRAYIRTAEVKLGPIKNYMEAIIEKEIKFLFFAHHKSMVDGICDFLCSKKLTFIKIDGTTPTSERSKCCELFQTDSKCKAAVLSITAAGVGLNLTAAQLVIFGELYYTPGALIQAEDRVHRIGQKDSVYIEYLIAPGTVDDHIWNMVHRKIETLDALGIKSDGFEFDKSNSQDVKK